VLLDEMSHNLTAGLQGLDGMDLILCHEEGVPLYIGTEYGFKFACDLYLEG
jgi:hypothetical protein